MRILQIAPDHPLWTKGGTEHVAFDLSRVLAALPGVECRLLACATSLQRTRPAAGLIQAIGDDLVLWTDAYDRLALTRLDPEAWVPALDRVLRAHRPDVVHLHGLDRIGAEVLPWLRRTAPRSKIVLTLHAYQLLCANDGLLVRTTDGQRCSGPSADLCQRCFPEHSADRFRVREAHLKLLLDQVDWFVAPSAFIRDLHLAWGLPAERCILIPNAVDAPVGTTGSGKDEDRADAVAGARRTARRFAFFGNISPHKGVLTLLQAAERLRQQNVDVHITLHGGLQYAAKGFRRAFEERLTRAGSIVSHPGPYERSELPALMHATDWVVVPSTWWENAPLVILEAFRAGRPVICSGIGGMAEAVRHGVDGLHVAPGDAGDLADTMAAVSRRPALWKKLRDNLPQVPTLADYAARHLELYRRDGSRLAA